MDYNFCGLRGYSLLDGGSVLENNREFIVSRQKEAAHAYVSLMKKRARQQFPNKWGLLVCCWKEPLSVTPGTKMTQVELATMGKVVSNGEFSQRKGFWFQVEEEIKNGTEPMDRTTALKVTAVHQQLVKSKRQAKALVFDFSEKEKAVHEDWKCNICMDSSTGNLLYVGCRHTPTGRLTELVCDPSLELKTVMAILAYGESVDFHTLIGNLPIQQHV